MRKLKIPAAGCQPPPGDRPCPEQTSGRVLSEGATDSTAKGTDAPDPNDPFNPENLRIDQSFLNRSVAKKMLATVPVKRPNKQDFVRVHPDSNYHITVALIELKADRECFLIAPAYAKQLADDVCATYMLALTINRQEVPFFWPLRLPDPSGRQNNWHTSAVEAANASIKDWVRVVPNLDLGAYEIIIAEKRLFEPEWPEIPIHELLRIECPPTCLKPGMSKSADV
jgi:hypothetical protein